VEWVAEWVVEWVAEWAVEWVVEWVAEWLVAEWLVAEWLVVEWLVVEWLVVEWLAVEWLAVEWLAVWHTCNGRQDNMTEYDYKLFGTIYPYLEPERMRPSLCTRMSCVFPPWPRCHHLRWKQLRSESAERTQLLQ